MKKIIILILILNSALLAQNLEKYYNMLDQGKIESAQENIEQLCKNYPDNPEVLFLSGIVETNSDQAINIYEKIIENHPDSKIANRARVELIKYYYSNGLYHKTVEETKSFISEKPNSELTKEIVGLLFCSLQAIKRTDLIDFYQNKLSNNYPQLTPYIKNSNYLDIYTVKQQGRFSEQSIEDSGEYALQVGAFSNPNNARNLLNNLKAEGYQAYLEKRSANQRVQVVKIGPFSSRSRANQVGKQIERKFNLDYIIIKP
ncbi:MAG: SPOR domain-containing protein [Candidatus Marinimicrobia bacterium]|nr:SPOR domain-containing protein [Candidatus Neomarinimicrobiota bacterium]